MTSPFTINDNITLAGVHGHYDIYVGLVQEELVLFQDAAGQHQYSSDPKFVIPYGQKYAFYFRTLGTGQLIFPNGGGNGYPLNGGLATNSQEQPKPACLEYKIMNTLQTAFSVEVENTTAHTHEIENPFGVRVLGPSGIIVNFHREVHAVDPTVVENGEEGGGGGIE